jgi:hypothetical protein
MNKFIKLNNKYYPILNIQKNIKQSNSITQNNIDNIYCTKKKYSNN